MLGVLLVRAQSEYRAGEQGGKAAFSDLLKSAASEQHPPPPTENPFTMKPASLKSPTPAKNAPVESKAEEKKSLPAAEDKFSGVAKPPKKKNPSAPIPAAPEEAKVAPALPADLRKEATSLLNPPSISVLTIDHVGRAMYLLSQASAVGSDELYGLAAKHLTAMRPTTAQNLPKYLYLVKFLSQRTDYLSDADALRLSVKGIVQVLESSKPADSKNLMKTFGRDLAAVCEVLLQSPEFWLEKFSLGKRFDIAFATYDQKGSAEDFQTVLDLVGVHRELLGQDVAKYISSEVLNVHKRPPQSFGIKSETGANATADKIKLVFVNKDAIDSINQSPSLRREFAFGFAEGMGPAALTYKDASKLSETVISGRYSQGLGPSNNMANRLTTAFNPNDGTYIADVETQDKYGQHSAQTHRQAAADFYVAKRADPKNQKYVQFETPLELWNAD